MHAGFFVLRTPLLPLDVLRSFGAGSDEEARARQRLAEILTRPILREALYLGAPAVEAQLDGWVADPAEARRRTRRIETTLVRYASRIAARPTPFGLFAGHTLGTIDRSTSMELGPVTESEKHVTLDPDYVLELADALSTDRALRASLRFYPNASLYAVGDVLRATEPYLESRPRAWRSIPEGSGITDALSAASGGARPAEIVDAVARAHPGEREDIERLVDAMIEARLLVAELFAPLAGPEPLEHLCSVLERAPETAPIAAQLREAEAMLEATVCASSGAAPAAYQSVARTLAKLPVAPCEGRTFQVTLVRAARNARLGASVVRDLLDGAEWLARLAPPASDPLALFRDRFRERYGEREVPLTEALDEERGLGFSAFGGELAFGNPWLAGLDAAPRHAPAASTWSAREKFLAGYLEEALGRGEREVVLSPDALRRFEPEHARDLPPALSVRASLFRRRGAEGELIVQLHRVSGPSAAHELARFCHADPALAGRVRDLMVREAEAEADVLIAEIDHLPQGRIAGVMARPSLREARIALHGARDRGDPALLPISDLALRLVDDRLQLHSRSRNRAVLPRLTSAHDYRRPGSSFYSFLAALQGPSDPLVFHWGPLEAFSFLPRVRIGRVILSPARWTLPVELVLALRESRGEARARKLEALRETRRLPRWVQVLDGDRALCVDLANPLSVEAALAGTGRAPLVLTEALIDELEPAVRGPGGVYMNEIVVPFVRPATASPRRSTTAPSSVEVPSALPGGEYLFAKLYAGPRDVERVLSRIAAPLVDAVSATASVRWWFVRYGDPEWHVRVRLHADERVLQDFALPHLHALAARARAEGWLQRLVLDTYVPEVDRYGGPQALKLAEAIFDADSRAVLAALRIAGDDRTRSALALRGANLLLLDLGSSLAERRALVRARRDVLRRDGSLSSEWPRQVAARYRALQPSLRGLIEPVLPPGQLEAGEAALRARSPAIRSAAEAYFELDRRAQLTRSLPAIWTSLLHMFFNRIFARDGRLNELVVLEYLTRLYDERAHAAGRRVTHRQHGPRQEEVS